MTIASGYNCHKNETLREIEIGWDDVDCQNEVWSLLKSCYNIAIYCDNYSKRDRCFK